MKKKLVEKPVSFTSREFSEVYQALYERVKFYEDYFDINDVSFRFDHFAIYTAYVNVKNALEKVKSIYFG